jgi:predicted transposase/invertase (TIGR01784 family)
MDDKNPPHPHDNFFKESLAELDVAQSFLTNLLPKDILAKIDLSTLKPKKSNFIDNIIGKKEVDALFSVKFGQDTGYLYLLCEHQSTVDKYMAQRMMKYRMVISDYHRANNPKDPYLAPVYPMIIYNGTSPYNASLDFFDLFRDKQLAKDLFINPVQIINLPQVSDEEILKFTTSNLLLYMLKHIHDEDIFTSILKITDYLEDTANRNFLYIESIFRYILSKGQTEKTEEIVQLFTNITPDDKREQIMTIAEQLVQKGKLEGIHIGEAQGIEKGIEKAKYEVAIKMLKANQPIEFISQVTEISTEKLLELTNNQETKH